MTLNPSSFRLSVFVTGILALYLENKQGNYSAVSFSGSRVEISFFFRNTFKFLIISFRRCVCNIKNRYKILVEYLKGIAHMEILKQIGE